MYTRPIPSSGEALPIIGLGTYPNFDVAPGAAAYTALPAVIDALGVAGGTVIDTSPMYGRAEETLGELLAARPPAVAPFLATKVWTTGRAAGLAQMEASFRRLRAPRIDLLQIHNLVDWRTHLPTLRRWQDEGRIRYTGITHYTASAYRDVEAVLRAERFDVLQIDYSLEARAVEARLLPLAQLALAFVLGHAAVTCVIPGTGVARHMTDNAAVGGTAPLTAAQRSALAEAAR